MSILKAKLFDADDISQFEIRTLSTLNIVKCDSASDKLFTRLKRKSATDEKTLHAIADLSALCFYSVHQNGTRVFSSPLSAMKSCTAEFLCGISKLYFNQNSTECDYNSSFTEQLNSLKKGDIHV